ncbi:hypothetical protein COLO4_10869 [Corchorus olitorius]|uniref:non-specific serine/threonine protein kinase n=1 Tax=Corchorus olitorius TaxID=93759 RepID=A0A1R3K6M6_9ROSI|nr:hypothetical protein COLO4_10869 [Corchorus olitorius]
MLPCKSTTKIPGKLIPLFAFFYQIQYSIPDSCSSLVQSLIMKMNMIIHILLFFIAVRKSLSVDENFTICSVPKSCGSQSIKFPFFFQDEEQDFRCGYPGFNIFCRNNTDPILNLPDGDYIISNISYQTQSFHVSTAVPFGSNAVCSHSINNISIPEDRLVLPPNQKQVIFLYNCNLTSQLSSGLSRYKINCTGGDASNATWVLSDDDPLLKNASENCKGTVVAPVASHEGEKSVEDRLNGGFVLNWIASNCSICEGTGGHCGFDYSTYHFKCFCPDRPHAWHCAPGKSNLVRTIIVAAGNN